MKTESGRVIEIIGLCGAGKSTLAALLNERNTGLTIWGLPKIWLAKSTIVSFPTFFRIWISNKKISREEIKQIIRINAFTGFVKRQDYSSGTFFFDEGAIFAISKLRIDSQNEPAILENWEEGILNHWKELVKTIIWLDSDDEVLIKRIQQRSKHHRMKDKTNEEIVEFLQQYRLAYENVVRKFAGNDRVNILKFDTGKRDLKDIADEISFKIGSKRASQREVLPIQKVEVGL